mgnify:CR=1 FL=1
MVYLQDARLPNARAKRLDSAEIVGGGRRGLVTVVILPSCGVLGKGVQDFDTNVNELAFVVPLTPSGCRVTIRSMDNKQPPDSAQTKNEQDDAVRQVIEVGGFLGLPGDIDPTTGFLSVRGHLRYARAGLWNFGHHVKHAALTFINR